MNSAGDKKMVKRFVAGWSGRRWNAAKGDYSLPNYAVTDTQPGIDSDGRCSDHDTLEAAQAEAELRNELFASCQVDDFGRNVADLEWRQVPGRGFFAWLKPEPKFTTYID